MLIEPDDCFGQYSYVGLFWAKVETYLSRYQHL
jgi:hypothetical protein